MLLNNKKIHWTLLFIALIFFSSLCYFLYPKAIQAYEIRQCSIENSGEPEQINCWQELIRKEFDAKGTSAAFEMFEVVYKHYNTFAATGCHRHAHRVGDMSYYFDYLTHKDFRLMDFPKGATACGYGFYHGFFEHIIQDRPEPAFVTEMCEYMKEHLTDVAPAIAQTCYHGSGHGFLLARSDTLTQPEQWTLENFISIPLEQCESLPESTDHEKNECQQGVFNVIVDWMADEEYGLQYNYEAPFAVCDTQPESRQRDCYYEMAQKLDGASNFDPVEMLRLIETAKNPDMYGTAMSTGMAGIVQHSPHNSQQDLLLRCLEIENSGMQKSCVIGILGGLVEHSTPGTEYQAAIDFCEFPELTEELQGVCHAELVPKLRRFYTDEELRTRCATGALGKDFCEMSLLPRLEQDGER